MPLVAYFENTRLLVDEVYPGGNNDWGLNLKFLPTGFLNIGFSYYFGLDYDKYNKEMKRRNP